MADMQLAKHLCALNAIANEIAMVANYFPKTPANLDAAPGTPDSEIKFLLSQLLVIKLHCFLEKMGRVLGMIRRSPDGEVLLGKTKPIIRRLNQSRDGIAASRNKLIAHAQKDVEHPHSLILAHDMPTAYGELLLLARLADELRRRFVATYSADVTAAKECLREHQDQLASTMSAYDARQRIHSMDDLEREFGNILAEIPD